MGAFYYRPIDPGYAAAGAAVASGLERGVGNFLAGRERERQRREAEEAEQFRRQTWFLSQGGNLGDMPTEERPGATGATGPATRALLPRNEAAGGIPGESGILSMPGVTMPDIGKRTVQKGGYVGMGQGAFKGYIRDPELRREELYQEEAGHRLDEAMTAAEREEALRSRRGGELGLAANTLLRFPGQPNAPGVDDALGAFYKWGMTPPSGLLDEQEPVPGTPEWESMIEAEERIRAKYRVQPGAITDVDRLRQRSDRLAQVEELLARVYNPSIAQSPERIRAEEDRILSAAGYTRDTFAAEQAEVRQLMGSNAPAPRRNAVPGNRGFNVGGDEAADYFTANVERGPGNERNVRFQGVRGGPNTAARPQVSDDDVQDLTPPISDEEMSAAIRSSGETTLAGRVKWIERERSRNRDNTY